ncbi:hypothetical protein HPB51_007405 [Rhipicephalus microplus]|uniref:Uncharacterized protein n=1 Tax=Rhipicephalus microplus TaxID=6941 RepID=A0A9J6EZ54_RHIMP|nr:hypothetical protein HPB51_007405 [Rhipicephalus microplus]
MALVNEPSDAIVRPGPSRMTDTRRQELENMDFQDSTGKSLSTPNEMNGQNAETNSQNQADGAWQTVLTLRQRKALAKEKKAKSVNFFTTSYHQQVSPAEATRKSKYRPAHRWLPPLPKDDFKIVVRPHQGLPVKTLTTPLLADAVIEACNGKISGEQVLLRIKQGSNIFIVSTPHQTVADPVYYNGGELACNPHKVTTQVCKVCHQVGHRSDVFPQPDTRVCHVCGQRDPATGHECSPNSAACGEGHLTGDRSCRKRLKAPQKRTSRASVHQPTLNDTSAKPPQRPRWFSSDDEQSALDHCPESPETRPRFGSRYRSRSRSRTRKDSTHKTPP